MLLADRIIVLGRNPGADAHGLPRDAAAPARPQERGVYATGGLHLQGADAAGRAASGAAAPARRARPRSAATPHYQELPHARPGGIAGLLELLLDHDGQDDIYRLADDLGFEIDDLLPIVEAAQLLGFLNVTEGDVEITPAGRRFANSDILRQKELFRKAARATRAAVAADRARAGGQERPHAAARNSSTTCWTNISPKRVTLRQLETAISWGRYAELFDLRCGAEALLSCRKPHAEADSRGTKRAELTPRSQ